MLVSPPTVDATDIAGLMPPCAAEKSMLFMTAPTPPGLIIHWKVPTPDKRSCKSALEAPCENSMLDVPYTEES